MTVAEIIEKLRYYDNDKEVYMAERKTDFAFGLVNSVSDKDISILDDPYDDDENAPKINCVILDEQ